MAEELKDLIEKIQEEGVRAAQEKARSIEEEANRKAKSILNKATKEAGSIISKAEEKVSSMEESGKKSLKQAGRDLLLTLKKEINTMLDGLVVSHVQKVLNPQGMAKIIAQLIKETEGVEKKDLIVSLKKEDLKKLEGTLLKELKQKTKEGITLKSSEDITGGFLISYDKGKSCYDFTDKAIAQYITLYLEPKLAELLKEKK